jgi:type 1 glutamine amidotransferase
MKGDQVQLRLAVVTGGHAYDVPNFQRLFQRLAGMDAYVQSMDDFASSSQETRDAYDGIVFYHMLKGTPLDTGQPWYSGKPLQALERLQETGQGLVVMHHALLAYEDWPVWRELSGINPVLHSYHHDQLVKVRVLNREHPITAGLADFELVDETYVVDEPDAGNEILLVTDHPQSVNALAWVRGFGRSKVFSLALGHDDQCWSNPHYAEVLRRGIVWAIGKQA